MPIRRALLAPALVCLLAPLAGCDDAEPSPGADPSDGAAVDGRVDGQAPDGAADDAALADAGPEADAMTSDTDPDAMTPDAAPEGDSGMGSPAFTFLGAEPAECPLAENACADWPAEGAVQRLASTERFGDVEHDRTAWLYHPPAAEGPLPLLIFLHGGNGNGAAMFARRFDELARGDDIQWRQGDADCQFTYGEGFRNADGGRCLAPNQTYRGTEPFALLLPDGIRSVSTRIPDARHWEDGRSPSPGQLVEEETRDDVGYIAHLIETLLDDGAVDPTRIYVAGWSNGGMMTQRVVCEMGRPGREPLRAIAAVAVGIAAMPSNLYQGSDGRPQCPRDGFDPPAMYFQVGRGIDTPDCPDYPCDAPVVDGDGLVPYGAPGEQHLNYSPDGGWIWSFEDTRDLFDGALDAAYGTDDAAAVDGIGLFTERRVTTYGGAAAELRVLVTDGGAHEVGGVRGEFASEGRQWRFLSRFQRVDGQVGVRDAGSIEGTF